MNGRDAVARTVAVDRLRTLRRDESGPTERVELVRAGGRVLARPVVAPSDVPRYDRATMDGFAFAADDDYPLSVVGDVSPEDDPPDLGPGEAVAVATGAPLPERADAVLMREEATRSADSDGLSGPPRQPGTNVYPAGATASAGERLFEAGQRLAPRHVSLLRDVGVDAVTVRTPFDVALVATGTEIHEGRQPDRDSEMLANLLRGWGHDPTVEATVPDDADAVRESIETAAATSDAVVTTGGTSVGHADYVVDVLCDHDVLFRGVALRPGRPMTVAVVDGTPVFALPGKPLAAHTAATFVARAYFAGATRFPMLAAVLPVDVGVPGNDGDDVEFAVPVTLDGDEATPLGHVDSSLPLYDDRFAPGRVAASTRVSLADGVVLTESALESGDRVDVIPYDAVE